MMRGKWKHWLAIEGRIEVIYACFLNDGEKNKKITGSKTSVYKLIGKAFKMHMAGAVTRSHANDSELGI
jgi:hypothetical protein